MMFDRPNQLWVGDYHDARLLFDPVAYSEATRARVPT
jgi:hypothetical protein